MTRKLPAMTPHPTIFSLNLAPLALSTRTAFPAILNTETMLLLQTEAKKKNQTRPACQDPRPRARARTPNKALVRSPASHSSFCPSLSQQTHASSSLLNTSRSTGAHDDPHPPEDTRRKKSQPRGPASPASYHHHHRQCPAVVLSARSRRLFPSHTCTSIPIQLFSRAQSADIISYIRERDRFGEKGASSRA